MMRASNDDSELERLREENRYLRGLLTGQEPTDEVLAVPEQRDMVPAHTQAHTHEGLEQQVRLFDTALSWIADYVFICDRQGRITYANRARLHFWQRELKDVLGKTFFELGYPDELAARIHAQVETVIATREPLRTESEYTPASGRVGYYDYILVPIFDPEGRVEAVAGSTRDISDRHREQTEKEALLKTLQVERERLTSLFLQAPAFIAVLRGPQHVFEMVNSPYYQLVGHRELIGCPVREVLPELEGQPFFEILDDVYRTGQPFVGKQMRIYLQEAEEAPVRERYVDFVYQPLVDADGSISGIFAHGVDLTEQRHAEAALRESEELFRTTLHSIGDAVIATDAAGSITFMNSVAEQLTGWAFTDAAGRASTEIFHIVNEQTRQDVPSPIHRVLREGTIVGLANYTVLLAQDGSEYPIEDSGAPIRDEAGNVRGAVLVFRDVTESRRKEQAVQQSRERTEQVRAHLAAIIHSSDDAIISKDLTGIITSWNPAAERIYGYTAQEIIGRSKSLLIPAEMPEELPTILRRIRAGERIEHYETVRVRKDGTRINLSISVSPVHDAHGNIVGASTIAHDISERLQHLQEIEALNARLQRSIQETHHRVKNNLQIISALTELQMEEGQVMIPATALTRIGQHTRNLAAVHDLLTQEARAGARTDSISTKAALDKLIPLLQATTGGRRIAYKADDFRMPVREGASLALLISELVSNAVKHGRVDIELTLAVEEDRARLEVCDDGPGFPPGFDWRTAANTGLELIDSTGRYDLRGTISYENRDQGGARVVVIFPVPQPKGES